MKLKDIKKKTFDLLLWLGITIELKINWKVRGKQWDFAFPDQTKPVVFHSRQVLILVDPSPLNENEINLLEKAFGIYPDGMHNGKKCLTKFDSRPINAKNVNDYDGLVAEFSNGRYSPPLDSDNTHDTPPDLSQPIAGCDWGDGDPKVILAWACHTEGLTENQIKEADAHLGEYAERYLESIKSEPPPLDLSNPDEAIVAFDNAIKAATTAVKGFNNAVKGED